MKPRICPHRLGISHIPVRHAISLAEVLTQRVPIFSQETVPPFRKRIRWVGNVKEASGSYMKNHVNISIQTPSLLPSTALLRAAQTVCSSKDAHGRKGRTTAKRAGDILEMSSSQICGRQNFSHQEFCSASVLCSQGKQLGLQGRSQRRTEETLDRVFMCNHHSLYKRM